MLLINEHSSEDRNIHERKGRAPEEISPVAVQNVQTSQYGFNLSWVKDQSSLRNKGNLLCLCVGSLLKAKLSFMAPTDLSASAVTRPSTAAVPTARMARGSSSLPASSAKHAIESPPILEFKNLCVSIPSKLGAGAHETPQQDQGTASRWRCVGLTPGREMKPILQGASGSLRGGELTAILGPSGAGKTTLFDALMGRAHGIGGEVLLDGQPFNESFRDITGMKSVP